MGKNPDRGRSAIHLRSHNIPLSKCFTEDRGRVPITKLLINKDNIVLVLAGSLLET